MSGPADYPRLVYSRGEDPSPLPPHDHDAQAAILSACMGPGGGAALVDALPLLQASHFYGGPHALIWEAIRAVRAVDEPVDIVQVGTWLKNRGRIAEVGGMSFLIELLDVTPAYATKSVQAYAKTVIEHATRRQLTTAVREFCAASEATTRPTVELITDFRNTLERLERSSVNADPFPLLDAEAIFAPRPPVPYLFKALDLCPGRPPMFCAAPFKAKTISAQSLAVSVAAGLPAWGEFPVREGAVSHFDGEQGVNLSATRYTRIARAHGVNWQRLQGKLRLAVYPPVKLNDPRAEDVYSRLLEGCTFAIFDSFRSLTPGLEENSSEADVPLNMLGRVSSKTGATILTIHHARKRSKDDGGLSVRGSSAIEGASGSIIEFDGGSNGEPLRVHQKRAPESGVCCDDFFLSVEDVTIDGDPRGGLRVQYVSEEALAASVVAKDGSPLSPLDRMKRDIIELVARDRGLATKEAVTSQITGRATTVRAAYAELVAKGIIIIHEGVHRLRSEVT